MSVEDMTDIKELKSEPEDEDSEMGQFVGDHNSLFHNDLLDSNYDASEYDTKAPSLLDENTNNNDSGGEMYRIDDSDHHQDLSFYNEVLRYDNCTHRGKKSNHLLQSQRTPTCGHCGYSTTCNEDFKSHLRSHISVRQHQCKRRLYATEDASILRKRSIVYKCEKCQYTTKRKDCLAQHVAIHKQIVIKLKLNFRSDSLQPTKSQEYKCKQCNFATRHWKDFKLHIPKHNPLNAKVYKCDHCDFTTKWRQNLKPHLETHKSYQAVVYRCDQCSYATPLKRYLTQHCQQHTPRKQFKCRQCSFSTNWRKHLKQHTEVHNSSEAYQCDDCGFSTNSKRNLQLHFKKYGNLSSHGKLMF